ncbi:MAG: hypothetical protein H6916_05485 [Novosphingobium sp.]|uniref:hypothetical protein n=1 Tax=Novosphingobium sp. TaxID=1874826 RepID=UPI002627398E|nr:hypothetical protein [Novosphingobium sp.]MCP5386256.1 hypothetical protein [Novosphingobium sp.]
MLIAASGVTFAFQNTAEARCVAEQEEFYLENWYRDLPERARDSAIVYCAQNNDIPQRALGSR